VHLYVHLMEMSPFPEQALPVADELRSLVPDAGPLVHMPTHIDVLCGDYKSTLESNLRAIEVNEKYVAREGRVGFHALYHAHDRHFAIYGAMFLGRSQVALGPSLALRATSGRLRRPSADARVGRAARVSSRRRLAPASVAKRQRGQLIIPACSPRDSESDPCAHAEAGRPRIRARRPSQRGRGIGQGMAAAGRSARKLHVPARLRLACAISDAWPSPAAPL
jgi:hypothetical protein